MSQGLVFPLLVLLLVTLALAQQGGWGGQGQGGWGANPAGAALSDAVGRVGGAVQGAIQGAMQAGQRG
ncbi:unnamed protein product [Haemonchus placei]|uniref:DUF148 domain-containing protein n=2 Tax=Haemonchus placei TaxID=6290 RepID=A0A0N4VWS5_HAEPC|nr:unnamed protein product [Haemonchus placei]